MLALIVKAAFGLEQVAGGATGRIAAALLNGDGYPELAEQVDRNIWYREAD